jgi:uncharacterized protein (TIGR02996 family)
MNQDALLQAVISAPDDDTPRLNYASWIENQGDSDRAEFIRVQCALASLPATDPRRPSFVQREQELLAMYKWTWAEEFGTDIQEWTYGRGFIERVDIDYDAAPETILELLQRAPIRHLRDSGPVHSLAAVVGALPALERLTGLEFWRMQEREDALLRQLLNAPQLRNLQTLILHVHGLPLDSKPLNEAVLIDGLTSPYRGNIRELAVNVDGWHRGPSPRIIHAIARSPSLVQLQRLDLSHAKLGLRTIDTMVKSTTFRQLAMLDLRGARATEAGWNAMLRFVARAQLRWLRLRYAYVVDHDNTVLGELRDIPTYRTAFEQYVQTVDWHTAYIDPWDGTASWQGFSWEARRRQALFALQRFLPDCAYADLERTYYTLCRDQAGPDIAERIAALPFADYEAMLAQGLTTAITRLPQNNGQAIYFRVRGERWDYAQFTIHAEDDVTAPIPREERSYTDTLHVPVAAFPPAADIVNQYPLDEGITPSSPGLYIVARTLATLGRCLQRTTSPVPVYFSCNYAVFRL